MKCSNVFCIYWSDDECLLDNITLDIQGNCECCIYVNIDDAELQKHRKKLLSKYK